MKKRDRPRKSTAVQNPTVDVPLENRHVESLPLITEIPILRKHLPKKSKIEDNQTKTKLVVLKFMIRKRRAQQQISKKKLSEINIEKVAP
jgi:hypothetical protein